MFLLKFVLLLFFRRESLAVCDPQSFSACSVFVFNKVGNWNDFYALCNKMCKECIPALKKTYQKGDVL